MYKYARARLSGAIGGITYRVQGIQVAVWVLARVVSGFLGRFPAKAVPGSRSVVGSGPHRALWSIGSAALRPEVIPQAVQRAG